MEIGQIINGHVNEILGLNKDISKLRLEICYRCPLYTTKLGGMCNDKLWYNANTGDVSVYEQDGYKRGCGCRLLAKTRLTNASCPLNKW